MSEAVTWRLVTALLFSTATAIGVMTGSPVAVVLVLVTWQAWLTLTAATREELRIHRRRAVVALARLRRRHDAELLEVWCRVYEKPAAEYVPEGLDAPRELEQPTLEPVTEPIPLPDPFPATQPDMKAAASVGPVPALTWEERSAQMLAEWRKAAAEIGGAA